MIEERKIVISLITSTEYIERIQDCWTVKLFESQTAKRIAMWCMEYYNKYKTAPGKEIETIYYQKKKNGLPKDLATEIEEDILPGLSEEYETSYDNVDYLVDVTRKYFSERSLLKHTEEVQSLLISGKTVEAEKLAVSYKPLAKEPIATVEMSEENILGRIDQAFNRTSEPIIEYPGALGEFWNDQLIRGGFVALLAREKMGKTFMMIDMAMRAAKQGRRVAFFEAGDMNEDQLIKRLCIYLAQRSDKAKYCGEMWQPTKDCIFNQTDTCDKEERACSFGVKDMIHDEAHKLRQNITQKELIELFKQNKKYTPCSHCDEYKYNKWGTNWVEQIDVGGPLTAEDAKRYVEKFFIGKNRRFKISCTPSGTLTVAHSLSMLDVWEKTDGFIPDVIFWDYPDIMTDNTEKDIRARQNKIWMDLRGVPDNRHCLAIVVTQADANSYTKDLLSLENFSEDKRKYAHVTAMYGLNQDHKGREKANGVIRINEMVVREGDFNVTNQVYVLQNLRRGRPVLTSYW
jgi:hypothetical protein